VRSRDDDVGLGGGTIEHGARTELMARDEATRERLLDDDVLPARERVEGERCVQMVGDAQVDDVDAGIGEQIGRGLLGVCRRDGDDLDVDPVHALPRVGVQARREPTADHADA
jgi:hypothetical protein